MRTITTFTLLLTLGACAEDLGDEPTPDGGPAVTLDMAVAPPSDHVQHTDLGDGVTETLVDGTDTESWIALDLDGAGAELDVDIATDTEWDLAIQRYHFRTNGGAGGPANVRVAILDGVTLADVTEAPSEGWAQDAEPTETDIPDEVPMGEEPPPATVISNDDDPWYQYDPTTHALTPKERVYVLESTEGAYFALQVVDYYSPVTAEAGWPAFQWKAVDPPSESEPGQAVDASSRDEWVYLQLDGTEVSVTDPESSSDWDLALQRTAIRTNSGPSGPGVGGALLSEREWDAIEHTDSVGFARDELVPLPGPPGSGEAPGNPVLGDWYDYDGATHIVSARPDDSYIVRGANGDYAKLRIFGWDGGVYRLELAPVTLAPETQTTTVDASDAWVYLSLDLGAAVTPADPATEPSWDLALQRTNLRTNSGTSGEGGGGAANAEVASLAEVTTVPETFAVDEMVPLPGPPGSGEVSANPVLSDWYDYDFTTHAVTPKATVFVVRTARGDFVKVAITSYEDGVFELQWIHAGAGQSAFGGE